MIMGTDIMASMIRMSTASTIRPPMPATRPTSIPKPPAISVEAMPTTSDTWLP